MDRSRASPSGAERQDVEGDGCRKEPVSTLGEGMLRAKSFVEVCVPWLKVHTGFGGSAAILESSACGTGIGMGTGIGRGTGRGTTMG